MFEAGVTGTPGSLSWMVKFAGCCSTPITTGSGTIASGITGKRTNTVGNSRKDNSTPALRFKWYFWSSLVRQVKKKEEMDLRSKRLVSITCSESQTTRVPRPSWQTSNSSANCNFNRWRGRPVHTSSVDYTGTLAYTKDKRNSSCVFCVFQCSSVIDWMKKGPEGLPIY